MPWLVRGYRLHNLSDSDDTRVLEKALEEIQLSRMWVMPVLPCVFLPHISATRQRRVILTGSDRMKQRPIGPLVDALRQLGAQIEYMEKEGCPPLKISGGELKGGAIEIDGGISSQFISALMMMGPVLEGGLQINLTGEVVSATYIRMTLALMKQCRCRSYF